MTPKNTDIEVEFETVGLYAYHLLAPTNKKLAHPASMPKLHRHNDLELVYVESGALSYNFNGQCVDVRPRQMLLFWAGISHMTAGISPSMEMLGMHIPFAWFLNWKLPDFMTQRLLGGERMVETGPECSGPDRALLKRCVTDLYSPVPEIRKAILLEVEARLCRFSASHAPGQASPHRSPNYIVRQDGFRRVEEMARFVSDNFKKPIRVEDIAAAVGLHPNYAMKLFHQSFGVSLGHYINQHRITLAQRLLTVSDDKILDIAMEAGFGSISRFNVSFKKTMGVTPRRYREAPQASRPKPLR
jgi:AraC-like DNA-binding protein